LNLVATFDLSTNAKDMYQFETITTKTGQFNGNNGIFEGAEYACKYECQHCHNNVVVDKQEDVLFHELTQFTLCEDCFKYYNQPE
jgi:hypothetical protein